MMKLCAVLAGVVFLVEVLRCVESKSVTLVRDVEIELPANEKISKRDTSAFTRPEQLDPSLLEENVEEPAAPGPLPEGSFNSRQKRFLQNTAGFPLEHLMGRL